MKRYLIGFVALLALSLVYALAMVSPSQAQWGPGEHISDDLVACWDMEEESGTRYDAVGSNDLTDNNTVGVTSGISGNAANFELENNEFLSIPDNGNLSSGQDFTITGWVFMSSIDDVNTIIFYKNNEYQFLYRDTTDKWIARINNISLDQLSDYPAVGYWRFFILWDQYDGDSCYQIDDSQPICIDITSTDTENDFIISAATSYGLDGKIDSMSRWNRVLSDDEIAWIYNDGQARPCSHLINGPTPTPTSTPTSTPGAQDVILPSGDTLALERSISYGDIGVYIVGLALLLVLVVLGLVWITQRNISRHG